MLARTRSIRIILITGLLAALAPSAALAAVEVGSDGGAGGSTASCNAPPCLLTLDKVDGTFVNPPSGVITSWGVLGGNGSGRLVVLRDRDGVFASDVLAARVVGLSETGNLAASALPARIPVRPGDYIGIGLIGGASLNADTDATTAPSNDLTYESALPAGIGSNADATATAPDDYYEPYAAAVVEADADGDGYGDETQDGCPANRATHGACPRPAATAGPPTPTAATRKVQVGSTSTTLKKGSASISITNPNAAAVKGKLSLKLRKKKAGSKAYSLSGSQTKAVNVKLSKAAKRRVKRKGKVKLALSITAKGATGRSFTTTAKLTVKAAAKKKKRRRQTAPGGGSALDGSYEKHPDSGPALKFKVEGGGRRIVNLTGVVSGSCFFPSFPTGGRTVLQGLFPAINSMAVAADGTFAGRQEFDGFKTEITNGLLKGGIATGTILVQGKGCSGKANFKSRRTGA